MTCDGAEEVVSQVKVPWGSESDRQFVLDISFEAPANAGLRTAELVCIFAASPMQIFQSCLFLLSGGYTNTSGEACFQCSIVLNMHWWWDGLDRLGSRWVSFHLSHHWRFCWSSSLLIKALIILTARWLDFPCS